MTPAEGLWALVGLSAIFNVQMWIIAAKQRRIINTLCEENDTLAERVRTLSLALKAEQFGVVADKFERDQQW